MKKALSIILSLVLVIAALPLSAVNSVAYSGETIIRSQDNLWNYYLDSNNNAIIYTPNGNNAYFGFEYNLTVPSMIDGHTVVEIGDYAFFGCDSLTSISIPDGVTSIGGSAFAGCISLTSITIPDGVTSIGESAFYGCNSLTSITIPDGVTSIGESAFAGCTLLTSITIPDGVTSIGNYALYGCNSLTSIYIPDSVINLEGFALSGVSSLTDITVDVNNPAYCSLDGVLFNKSMTEIICYPQGKTATTYSIPDGVTSIGNYALYGCNSLTSIYIPDNVTSIGDHAFSWCTSLISITIPDGVTSIGESAFAGCASLTSIYIPDSVTSIGNFAFENVASEFSIYGVAGSYAETYAHSNSIPFSSGYRVFISISVDGELDTSSIWSLKDNRETPNQYYNGSIINVAENGVVSPEDTLTLSISEVPGYGCEGTILNGNDTIKVSDGEYPVTIVPEGHLYINLHFYSRQDYTTLYFRNPLTGSFFSQKYPKTETSFIFPENSFTNLHGLFNNWNTASDGSGTAYLPNEALALPSADTTYYAVWDEAYFLSFNKNNGTGSMDKIGVPTASEPKLTVPECEFTRNGYAFMCWNTKANGSGDNYEPNDKIILLANTTLYAQWAKAWTVYLHSNFGSDTTVRQEVAKGFFANITTNPFTRGGYRFVGWNTAADGSGTSYADGASLYPTANVHLYAQWERDYDINDDGVEDINDIGFIISASAGNVEMTSAQTAKSDFNGDTVVDGFDAAELDRLMKATV